MNRFENKFCPVCRSRFNDKADIVVCPICGTPHHRTCYNINGACALEALHASGWSWNGKLPDEIDETTGQQTVDATVTASLDTQSDSHHAEYPSGTPNSSESSKLPYERERKMFEEQFGEDDPFKEVFVNFGNNEIGEDGVSMHELVAYSATSVYHYGRAFNLFRGTSDGKKHVASFNFSSGLFAPVFQFYRRMNFFGVITLLLILLPSVIIALTPEATLMSNSMALVYNILEFVSLAFKILLCVFGDYIYYRHCVKNIVRFRKSYDGDTKSEDYFVSLYESGKPTYIGGAIGCLAFTFAYICVFTFSGAV